MKRFLLFWLFLIIAISCSKYQVGHALLGMPSTRVKTITFETNPSIPELTFVYPELKTDPYLAELRETHQLEKVVAEDKTDLEKALSILNWTHQQWEHNGSNEPSKPDALTILNETKQGKKFRCVEYGLVVTDALQAIGLHARMLGLKTRDVETCKAAAGHVLAEVWLKEFNKWAILDGQFNILPVLEGKPLNAVEFQSAIVQSKPVQFMRKSGIVPKENRRAYFHFISHYLFYFDVSLDERRLVDNNIRDKIDGKTRLMLVPSGAKNPEIFQQKYPMRYCVYTHSLADFYKPPGL